MRALSLCVLMLLLSLVFSTGCREIIIERQVRVVFTNTTSDRVTLNIGGDDHVVTIGALVDDQFYAKLRMTGNADFGFMGPLGDWTDISISVLNLRTGRRSDQVMCRFQFGSVTYIEYRRDWLSCRLNFF